MLLFSTNLFDGLESLQGNITAHGRAWSKDTITKVEYRVNGGAWQLASGTTTWTTAPIQLSEGWNTVQVRAHDSMGRVATAQVRVKYTPQILQNGRWAYYELPWPIYKKGTFYTQTGYRIEIKAGGDMSYNDYLNGNEPEIKVYTPSGKLYLQSTGKQTVPGKFDIEYTVEKSVDTSQSNRYYGNRWVLSNDKVEPLELSSGWVILKNVRIYLYEMEQGPHLPERVIYQWMEGCGYSSDCEYWEKDILTAARIFSGPNTKTWNGKYGFLVIQNLYLPGDYAPPVIGRVGYAVATREEGYQKYDDDLAEASPSYTNVSRVEEIVESDVDCPEKNGEVYCNAVNYYIRKPRLQSSEAVSETTMLCVDVSDDNANPLVLPDLVHYGSKKHDDYFYGNRLREYFETATPNVRVWINGVETNYENSMSSGTSWEFTGGLDVYVVEHYNAFCGSSHCIEYEVSIVAPRGIYCISPSEAGLKPGYNDVTVVAKDMAGRTARRVFRVYYDNRPPVLVSDSIPTKLTDPRQVLQAKFSDDYGIAKIEIKADSGIIEWYDEKTGKWVRSMSGQVIVFEDFSSRKKSKTVRFRLIPEKPSVRLTFRVTDVAHQVSEFAKTIDASAVTPQIIITSHTDGGYHSSPTKSGWVYGYIVAANENAVPRWVKVAGPRGEFVNAEVEVDTGSPCVKPHCINYWGTRICNGCDVYSRYKYEAASLRLLLNSGWNTITVKARDKTGRVVSRSIRVYYSDGAFTSFTFDDRKLPEDLKFQISGFAGDGKGGYEIYHDMFRCYFLNTYQNRPDIRTNHFSRRDTRPVTIAPGLTRIDVKHFAAWGRTGVETSRYSDVGHFYVGPMRSFYDFSYTYSTSSNDIYRDEGCGDYGTYNMRLYLDDLTLSKRESVSSCNLVEGNGTGTYSAPSGAFISAVELSDGSGYIEERSSPLRFYNSSSGSWTALDSVGRVWTWDPSICGWSWGCSVYLYPKRWTAGDMSITKIEVMEDISWIALVCRP